MICISFFKIPYFTFVRWWIVKVKKELSKYYLMMTTLVNRRVDIRNYNQIWLGGEDKIDTGRRFSLNVACFINSFLQPKLRGYCTNFSTFKGCCITSIPVVRLKSLVTTIKNGLLAEIVSRVSSKLFHKFSKSSLDSFGDHLNN